ncbi:MAG: MFS transporter [Actinobacteria bacterium]|nr:MFS transporter [Actinomycetota bacterium]
MRRLLLLTGAIVFVDTMFFAVLTPLLPHYAHALHLGKGGAGALAAAYPAGTLVGSVPSGVVAARLGVKPTVLAGMTVVAATTALFGIAHAAWELDAARFCQGLASSFSWTGALAWLVAGAPGDRRGRLIGQAFAFAIGGALLGPVVGGIASVAGIGWTFGTVAAASLGVAVWAVTTPAVRPETPQPFATLARALGDPRIRWSVWFVVLPGLLFGTLSVLAPLRLSALGFGPVAIGATWLVAGALESLNNVGLGRMADRFGPFAPIRVALVTSTVVALVLPWPNERFALAAVVVCAGLSFGAFYTPGMTLLTHAAEARGLDYGYAFSLVNLAWAPGQAGGAALGGTIAESTSDAVPYLGLAGISLLTLAALWRFGSSS